MTFLNINKQIIVTAVAIAVGNCFTSVKQSLIMINVPKNVFTEYVACVCLKR